MQQLSEQEAIAFYESGAWKTWDSAQIVALALFQERLCVPFGLLHEAVEAELGRPVWTHEFAQPDNLRREWLGERPAPTLQDIMAQIPAEKAVFFVPRTPLGEGEATLALDATAK